MISDNSSLERADYFNHATCMHALFLLSFNINLPTSLATFSCMTLQEDELYAAEVEAGDPELAV